MQKLIVSPRVIFYFIFPSNLVQKISFIEEIAETNIPAAAILLTVVVDRSLGCVVYVLLFILMRVIVF